MQIASRRPVIKRVISPDVIGLDNVQKREGKEMNWDLHTRSVHGGMNLHHPSSSVIHPSLKWPNYKQYSVSWLLSKDALFLYNTTSWPQASFILAMASGLNRFTMIILSVKRQLEDSGTIGGLGGGRWRTLLITRRRRRSPGRVACLRVLMTSLLWPRSMLRTYIRQSSWSLQVASTIKRK